MSIETRLSTDGTDLFLMHRGPDAVGLIAALARKVDQAGCWFYSLNFHSEGFEEDRCGIEAVLHGRDALRILMDEIDGEDPLTFIPTEEDGIAPERMPTMQKYAALWFLSVSSIDRAGILECASTAIAKMFGNFVWLHADTDEDVPGRSLFEISAVIAFNRHYRAGAIRDNIYTSFRIRDDEESKGLRKRKGQDPMLDEAQVVLYPLRR